MTAKNDVVRAGRPTKKEQKCPNCGNIRYKTYYRVKGSFIPLGYFCKMCGTNTVEIGNIN